MGGKWECLRDLTCTVSLKNVQQIHRAIILDVKACQPGSIRPTGGILYGLSLFRVMVLERIDRT